MILTIPDKQRPVPINKKAMRTGELALGSGTVRTVAFFAIACNTGNMTRLRINDPDAVIFGIGNENSALGRNR